MALSIAQFLDLLRDSDLLAPDEVDALCARYPKNKRFQNADALARELVDSKSITGYQDQALREGRGHTLVLGEYVILRPIGAGGMGQVFQARHRRLDRLVALKVLPASFVENQAALKRFEREMKAVARLGHSNIVAAHDAREDKGIHYLVMEYVPGDDLHNLVKKHGPLAVETALDYTLQTALGLAHAHSQGVIHRDIKPANLLVDTKGTVKILDLGLARFDAEGDAVDALTKTGSLMGTADFMSPEQALNTKLADARADIYSLGCTLFYLLTGRAMYEGDTFMQRVVAHREQPIPSLADQCDGLPEGLAAVFERMVAKRQQDRYQSMEEVHAALTVCCAVKAAPVGASRRRSRVAEAPVGSAAAPSSKPSKVVSQVELPTHASAERSRLAPRDEALPLAEREGYVAGRRKTLYVLCGLGIISAAALLVAAILVGNALRGVPVPAEKSDPPGPSPETLAEQARSAGRSALRNWERIEADLPATLLPAEAAQAGEKWAAAETALASQDFSTAQAAYDKAAALFAAATTSGRQTRTHHDAAQAQLKKLSDKRRQWQERSSKLAPAKARAASEKADEAYAAAQASAGRVETLAAVPSDVASAIKLYDDAISAVAKREAEELAASTAKAAADQARQAWQLVAAELPEELHPPAAGTAAASWKGAEAALASQDHATARSQYDEAARLFAAARGTGEETRKRHAAAQASLTELVARRKAWQQVSKDIPADKLPKSAAQAEQAYALAQAGVNKVDTLALVSERASEAIKLYNRAETEYGELRKTSEGPFENSLKMKFVYIPPGEFDMGSPESEKDRDKDETLHHVRLTKGFHLGAHEVTVGQFREFVTKSKHKTDAETDGKGGWGFDEKTGKFEQKPEYTWKNPGFTQQDDHPVVNVSWNDAKAFCDWLSKTEGRAYRLPTEAEWEYACRGRTKTAYFSGDDPEALARVGNVADGTAKAKYPSWKDCITARDGYVFTAPVGRFEPNVFGLHDMHGNVWEWCSDWYGEYGGDAVDPSGAGLGSIRVNRGGGWFFTPRSCRSAFRDWLTPSDRGSYLGFRVALVPSGK